MNLDKLDRYLTTDYDLERAPDCDMCVVGRWCKNDGLCDGVLDGKVGDYDVDFLISLVGEICEWSRVDPFSKINWEKKGG